MQNKKDIIENVLAWTGAVTSIVAPFMSLLQFIAVCLAIAVSIKSLMRKK